MAKHSSHSARQSAEKPSGALVPAPTPQATAGFGLSAPAIHSDFTRNLPLSHYSWLLRTHAAKMVAFVLLALIATAFVTSRITPIYESTATLYVDREAERDVVGKDSQLAAAASPDADAFLSSQISLLQSDAVVRPLAEKYNLLEREKQIDLAKDDPQKISSIRTAPIVLKGLRIARPPNTYILLISYRSADPKVATSVANGVAESYIEHTYDIRIRSSEGLSKFLALQLDDMRAKTEASSARLITLEREMNVINPEEKTNILSSRLALLNTEYTKVQAERVRAQSVYNSLASGSVEGALGSSQSEELKEIIKRLNEEKQRFADIKALFGENHPEYARLQATIAELEGQVSATVQLLSKQAQSEFERNRNQESLLQKDVEDTKAQYDQLNLRSAEYQRAKQEADADRGLYEELVKKIREGEINSGFKNDMVRIADPARPGSKPVSPRLLLNLALALMLSSLASVFIVILSDRIDTTIKNPEQVALGLNTRVLGTLPALKKGAPLPGIARRAYPRKAGAVAISAEATHFEESIRTVRNSILLTDFDRELRSVLITSATPGEGKSTIVAHLAISHAEQRNRTLLIDADMRRPSLHRILHIPNTSGLATFLDGGIGWRDLLIQPYPDLELYVLPAGASTNRSHDFLGQMLPQLLAEAADDFDLTFLDAPPLLGFPEPLQMASAADGVIIVARAGQTDRTAVSAVLDTLHQLRANVAGLILNEVRKDTSSSYHYYGSNYRKYYGSRKDDKDKDAA